MNKLQQEIENLKEKVKKINCSKDAIKDGEWNKEHFIYCERNILNAKLSQTEKCIEIFKERDKQFVKRLKEEINKSNGCCDCSGRLNPYIYNDELIEIIDKLAKEFLQLEGEKE